MALFFVVAFHKVTEGPSGEVFIDPKYAPVTHWRLAVAPEAKPCP